jgi:cytochrome c peroxidase
MRRLKPMETRRALSAFLATLPVVPGPYLRTHDPELRTLVTRGAQLFLEDCADCHQPRGQDSQATALSSAELLVETAKRRPLVLGATGFAHAGAGPSFTNIGNRISPLMGLSRGGPYFASGSAPDLRAVLTGFARVRPGVHDASHGGVYDALQIAALEAFLRAL